MLYHLHSAFTSLKATTKPAARNLKLKKIKQSACCYAGAFVL